MDTIVNWLTLFVQRHPLLLRRALRFFKRLAPKKSRSLITHAAAVREVFERPQDFLMGHLNAPKLKTGPFLLGMDPEANPPAQTSRYATEKTILVAALLASIDTLPQLVAEESQHVLRELITATQRQAGTPAAASTVQSVVLDLGHGYAERVYARTFARYFGLDDPADPPTSLHLGTPPGEYTLMRFIRTMGTTIGSSHPAPFGLEEEALQVAPEFRSYLTRVVKNHIDGSRRQAAHTIVARLCTQADAFADGPEGIVRSVAGMLSAGASFSKVFASIVDELLRHDQLRDFKAAVARNDEPKVLAYILEAVRFRPPFPILVRFCPSARVLRGTASEQDVEFAPQSTLVFFPLAAMFDPAHVSQPEDFMLSRPEQVYMHFGAASRECIGKALIERFFLPMFRALFDAVPGLTSAKPGKFRFDSVALDTYHIGPVALASDPRPVCPFHGIAGMPGSAEATGS